MAGSPNTKDGTPDTEVPDDTSDRTSPQLDDLVRLLQSVAEITNKVSNLVYGLSDYTDNASTRRRLYAPIAAEIQSLAALTDHLTKDFYRKSEQYLYDDTASAVEALNNIALDHEVATREPGDTPIENSSLGNNWDKIQRHLDAIANELSADPGLIDQVRAHPVFKEAAGNDARLDPVVEEILREVQVSWDDRKKPEHKGQPWAKNASTYIAHFMARWISEGRLRQEHLLAIDDKLYNSYTTLLSRNQEWDLGLPKKEYVRLDDPAKAIDRVRLKAQVSARRYRMKKSTIR